MKEEIIVKIEGEDWKKLMDESYKKVSKEKKVDGFRPGTAPRNIFEKKYGKAPIMEEATNKLINREYDKIIKEGKIIPILEPKIEILNIDDNGIEIKFTFITDPKLTLGQYTNLGIKKKEVKVSKKDIEEAIKGIQRDYAEVVEKDGAIEDGDIAVIDYVGYKGDTAFDGGKGENYSLTIGSNTFIPGFEEGLIGLKKGDKKDLELTFPENYHSDELKGQKVVFKVTVNDVKTRVIPELNKEFFEDLGMENINSKEDLENEIKKELTSQKEKNAENEYAEELIKAAVANLSGEIAEEILEEEANSMYQEELNKASRYGLLEEDYLRHFNKTKEELLKEFLKDAEIRVKTKYLIREIIKEKNLEVSEEDFNKKVEETCEKFNLTKEQVLMNGGEEFIRNNILIDKVIDILKS